MAGHGENSKQERSDNDTPWGSKYDFAELEIGQSKLITGNEGNIRSAASMWGTRYGIWFTVSRVDDGVVKVTRVARAFSPKRDRIETALRSIAESLIEIKEMLKEKEK